MPKLTIDNREVTVPEGTNVLEAARALDIVIPHFCYHEALGAVGACRLCAMTFLEGPVEGLQMACMVKAQDGMVVSTLDEKAVDLRRHVIEWSMMHHPHDCPVCDEGGECQLQDMTVAGGHGIRRYRGKKRTFLNQDLGPFVHQEMNRCITCYRCVRTYRDYCGGTDFGTFGSRGRVFFGRRTDGRLESPFSGNLVDVCPTGVFTDKVFRYTSRCWDLQEAPSICPHCSLGCATIPGARYRELQRVRAGINREINGFFICDRGRFGFDYVNHPARPRQPRVDGQATTMTQAMAAAERRVREMAEQHGPESLVFLGSSRSSLEANILLARWAARYDCEQVFFEAHAERDRTARLLTARRGNHAASLADLRQSDLVAVFGADLLAEGPMAAVALRQAVRRGARVLVFDPRPIELPCSFEHLAVEPARLPKILQAIAAKRPKDLLERERLLVQPLLENLQAAGIPVLIGGGDLLGSTGIDLLIDAAQALSTADRPVRIMTLLAGPNSYGGGLLSKASQDFDQLLDRIRAGTVKALISLETDPFREACDPPRVQTALGHLELLVVLDAVPGLAVQRADILLPTRTIAESDGCFINNEGRLQAFQQVFEPGLPIRETGDGDHPPREFRADTPGDAPEAAWRILAGILGLQDNLTAVRRRLATEDPRLQDLPSATPGDPGSRLAAVGIRPADRDQPLVETLAEPSLPLLAVPSFAEFDWLSHLSAPLRPLAAEPAAWLHPRVADRLGLSEGDAARLTTAEGHSRVRVHLSPAMADNLIIVPHLWNSALEGLLPGGQTAAGRLEKEETA